LTAKSSKIHNKGVWKKLSDHAALFVEGELPKESTLLQASGLERGTSIFARPPALSFELNGKVLHLE